MMENSNLFTKTNSETLIKLLSNFYNFENYVNMASYFWHQLSGTSRTRDQRNRRNQNTLEISERGKLFKALKMNNSEQLKRL